MPELAAAGDTQVCAEMFKSEFINGLPYPYQTCLYENLLLTLNQCQVTARQLMVADKLSLLSNNMTTAFLGMPKQPSSTVFPFNGASTAAPQIKLEPLIPGNASRIYCLEREDCDRSNRCNNNREYEDRAERRDSHHDYKYDRPPCHDYRDDFRSYRDSRYDDRYDRAQLEPPQYLSPRPVLRSI